MIKKALGITKIRGMIFIFLALLGTSCKIKSRTDLNQISPKSITLQNLICSKSTENLHQLSTQNDEILLLYFLLNDSLKLEKSWSSGIQVFENEDKSMELDHKISLPKNDWKLLLFLIEMDTERKPEEVLNLILENLEKSDEEIEMLILDDDLLGMKEIKSAFLNSNPHGKLRFWGIHLFDEFEYFLNYSTS